MLKLFMGLFCLYWLNETFADEKDLYDFMWLDPDKSVYVLQNKVFKKEQSFYTNFGLIKGFSTDFQNTKGLHARAGYFFSEEWGIEFLYNGLSNTDDEAFKNVTSVNNSVPFVRRINRYYGPMVVWAPFYGKINTFNKIIYTDLIFGAGVAKIDSESNKTAFRNNSSENRYEKESYTGFLWKSEFRIYLNQSWHLGIGVFNTNYQADGGQENSKKKIRMNTDGIVSLGFSF